MSGLSRFWPWLALALAALVALQSQWLASTQVSLAELESSQSTQAAAQAEQAQAATEKKAGALLQHASGQQRRRKIRQHHIAEGLPAVRPQVH